MRVTPTGCKTTVAGGTLEYGLSAEWPHDLAPDVAAHFRWRNGAWVRATLAEAVVEDCWEEPDLPGVEPVEMTDDEWAAAQVWNPQATEPEDAGPYVKWWIEAGDGNLTLEVRDGRKPKVASMPLEVARYVDEDDTTWSELVAYARSLLAARVTEFPVSRAGKFLRGEPRAAEVA